MTDILALLTGYSDQIIVGLIGGAVGGGLAELVRYIHGWYQAGRHRGADFHIAATMYTPIDPENPAHHRFKDAAANGKTHIQELIWLGQEIALKDFIPNPYVQREISTAMGKTKNEGLLLGLLPDRALRPLLKKILGHHNSIPANDTVRSFKQYAGIDTSGRIHGIAPPTHEHYEGSAHRRVLRAMFIANSQLENGLPPKDKIHFIQDAHANRYETMIALIAAHKADAARFDSCRAYF